METLHTESSRDPHGDPVQDLQNAIRKLVPNVTSEQLKRISDLAVKPEQILYAVAVFDNTELLFDKTRILIATFRDEDEDGIARMLSSDPYTDSWRVYYGTPDDLREYRVLSSLSSSGTDIEAEGLSVGLAGRHMGGGVRIYGAVELETAKSVEFFG